MSNGIDRFRTYPASTTILPEFPEIPVLPESFVEKFPELQEYRKKQLEFNKTAKANFMQKLTTAIRGGN